MEIHILNSLRANNTVTKNFTNFINGKGMTRDILVTSKFAAQHMNLFIEFFTGIYNLDIICKPDSFIVNKSGTNVISISAETSFENLFMLLIVALINYCEKPF